MTTPNVPELRRLLDEWRQLKEAWAAEATVYPPDGRVGWRLRDIEAKLTVALVNAAPALLDAIERVEKLEHLAETVQAVIGDSATVGGPTWVPVSKGVFEAMREALTALGEAGPS